MANTKQHIHVIESNLPISIIVNQFTGKVLVTNDDNILHVDHENLGIVTSTLDKWGCKYKIIDDI